MVWDGGEDEVGCRWVWFLGAWVLRGRWDAPDEVGDGMKVMGSEDGGF